MELSEAIKAGAKLAPQAFGFLKVGGVKYRNGKPPKRKLATCAIGAAKMAARERSMDDLRRRFPLLERHVDELPCECPQKVRDTVAHAIMHLNDWHKWRRETIAQWVKSVEEGK